MFKKGDSYFLFQTLPIDVNCWVDSNNNIKSVEIYEGIWIVKTPKHQLKSLNYFPRKEENISLGDWLYHDLHMVGAPIKNICIKVDSSISNPGEYFWSAILTLYLIKPLYMHITGSFIINEGSNTKFIIKSPTLYNRKANIAFYSSMFSQPSQNWLEYDQQNLDYFKEIFPIVLQYAKQEKNTRISQNLKSFSHCLFGNQIYYRDTLYRELFAIIDSLAGNPEHKHGKKISKQISQFLDSIECSINSNKKTTKDQIKDRLLDIWEQFRHNKAHGSIVPEAQKPSSPKSTPYQPNIDNNLLQLLDITRLTLLKLITLNSDDQNEYDSISYKVEPEKNKADIFFDKNYENKKIFFFTNLEEPQ